MYDCIVVGAGVMGTATARSLVKRDRSVVLLERFEIPHKRGSSHGNTRIFRYSYPDVRYVEMAIKAKHLWDELERDSGRELLTYVGGLDAGVGIENNRIAMESCGIKTEMLSGADANERWPYYRFGPVEDVLFQAGGAVVGAEDAWAAQAELALAGGAELRTGVIARGISDSGTSVTVDTDQGPVEGKTCVVTAGAWAKPLLATAGIDLEVTPTRETVSFYPLDVVDPPTIVHWADPLIYALPSREQGFKVAEHIAGPVSDPNTEGAPNEASVHRVVEWVAKHVPGANPVPSQVETCFYTNTPDESFVLKAHGNVIVGSPCSGHGFKFAPLIGETLADLAEQRL